MAATDDTDCPLPKKPTSAEILAPVLDELKRLARECPICHMPLDQGPSAESPRGMFVPGANYQWRQWVAGDGRGTGAVGHLWCFDVLSERRKAAAGNRTALPPLTGAGP